MSVTCPSKLIGRKRKRENDKTRRWIEEHDSANLVDSFELPKSTWAQSYFRLLYTTLFEFAQFSKPTYALSNGITNGVGASFFSEAAFSLSTPATLIIRPETHLGWIPDGGSHYLSRLPEKIGFFLALTGRAVPGHSLFNTHQIRSGQDTIDSLNERISQLYSQEKTPHFAVLENYEEKEARSHDDNELNLHQRQHLLEAFSEPTVQTCVAKLKGNPSMWARAVAHDVEQACPIAAHVTYRLLQEAGSQSLAECLAQEYRVAVRMLEQPDLWHGLKARLLHGAEPVWTHPSLDDVTAAEVDFFFKPLADKSDELHVGRDSAAKTVGNERVVRRSDSSAWSDGLSLDLAHFRQQQDAIEHGAHQLANNPELLERFLAKKQL